MLENPPKTASFDHVDENGDLIFIYENTPLKIYMDDTLKHAISESQRIKNGNDADSQSNTSQSSAALPISQIQALIRAGIEPSQVSARYHISEAQVRRFSSGVETEKQYAIEQFLSVPAPKQSNMRTLSDLIERTLAKARIGMETVKWRATRRGLEPWRIIAQFNTATRTIKAEWTWNMHDNTVSCMNTSSRLLLGEEIASATNLNSSKTSFNNTYRDTVNISFPFTNNEIPGNSIRSARIERAISQWENSNSEENNNSQNISQLDNQTDYKSGNKTEIHTLEDYVNKSSILDNSSKVKSDSHLSKKENRDYEFSNNSDHANNSPKLQSNTRDSHYSQENLILQKDDISEINSSESKKHTNKDNRSNKEYDSASVTSANKNTYSQVANSSENSSENSSTNANSNNSNNAYKNNRNSKDNSAKNNSNSTISNSNSKTHETQNNANTVEKSHSTEHKRRSGRSAVPSWDEILFGEG